MLHVAINRLMPALDLYHHNVREALIKDGWDITHDPLHLRWGRKDMYVDLGARQMIVAARDEQRIAVEIKSFINDSEMKDLRDAIGQFVIYRSVLQRTYPEFVLYMAVRDVVYTSLFEEPIGQLLIEDQNLKILVFNVEKEVIVKWKP